MTLTIKDALHSHKTTAGYQLEAIEEMNQCGQDDIINVIDSKIESIAEEMSDLDHIIEAAKANDADDDQARERHYTLMMELGRLTLARQAAVTCVVKHTPNTDELLEEYHSERQKNKQLEETNLAIQKRSCEKSLKIRELMQAVDRLENAHQETAAEVDQLHTDAGDALETVAEYKKYIGDLEEENGRLEAQLNQITELINQ